MIVVSVLLIMLFFLLLELGGLFCFIFAVFFWDNISLCIPGSAGTFFEDQVGLELTEV